MPAVKNKRQLAAEADMLASSFQCCLYQGVLYIPVDSTTGDWTVTPPTESKAWMPLRDKLQKIARKQFDTVFPTPSDLDAFEYMVMQAAEQHDEVVPSLLIETPEGLRMLKEDGGLHLPDGSFVPNRIPVVLNTDASDKETVRNLIVEWLGSEEEAVALLRHLATALAPGWSAVRYVLLLGDGRNGKSLLMQMMEKLLGRSNVSNVSRQSIGDGSPVVTELNGKLLNIIFDGEAVFLKDSGNEKSLVAGEEIGIRLLYRSSLTRVQTNALFIEGLNKEPKSSDKSSALQERLVRFWFKNTYEDDLVFKARMLSDQMLGALLALLIDNYVRKEDKSVMLAPTRASNELKIEHMSANSLGMQFIEHLVVTADPMDLLGMTVADLADEFRRWRLKDGDLGVWTAESVRSQFKTVLDFDRKSVRMGTRVVKVPVVTGFKKHTLELIEGLTHEEEQHVVVED